MLWTEKEFEGDIRKMQIKKWFKKGENITMVVVIALLILSVPVLWFDTKKEIQMKEIEKKLTSIEQREWFFNVPLQGTWYYVKNEDDYRLLLSKVTGRKSQKPSFPEWYLLVRKQYGDYTGYFLYSKNEIKEEIYRVLWSLPN